MGKGYQVELEGITEKRLGELKILLDAWYKTVGVGKEWRVEKGRYILPKLHVTDNAQRWTIHLLNRACDSAGRPAAVTSPETKVF